MRKILFFLFSLVATVSAVAQQEIAVKGNNMDIPHGDSSPSTTDNTDFGALGIATQLVTFTYWIENEGSSDLEITGNITSSDGQFTITQPTITAISPGGRVPFTITYDPLTVGNNAATISIPNDDSNESPFTFDVSGEGASLIDNDNDGVPDNIDLDDDNDGILDTDECTLSFVDFSTLGTSSLTSGDPSVVATTNIDGDPLLTDVTMSAPYNIVTSGSVIPTVNIAAIPGEINFNQNGTAMSYDVDFTFGQPNTPILSGGGISETRHNKNERLIIIPMGTVPPDFEWIVNSTSNATVTTLGNSAIVEGTTVGTVPPWAEYNITANQPIEGFTITFESDFNAGNNNTDIEISFCSDYDNDGIADYLDTDSDNDGCPDAIEGSDSFVWEDLTNDTISGGVDVNGVPIEAAGGQATGSSVDAGTNSCPTLDDSSLDTIWVCSGDSVTLLDKRGMAGGTWLSGETFTQLNNDSIKAAGVEAWYIYTGSSDKIRGENIVVNGDFEAGDADFTTEYATDCSAPIASGAYCIHDEPESFGASFAGCRDVSSGSGKMFITDASDVPGAKVWCQNVTVTQNTKYEFSAWITSLHVSNAPTLQFWVNGKTLGNEVQIEGTQCNWQNISGEWDSYQTTSAEICVINQNTGGIGNDFAMDDIYFGSIIKTPTSVRDSILVKTHPFPNVDLQDNETFCEGEDPVILDAGVHDTYQWNVGNETGQTITVDSTYEYKVTVTNAYGCSDSDSVLISYTSNLNDCNTDSDGDGVADWLDIDDDNDGILDEDESCPQSIGGLSPRLGFLFQNTPSEVYTIDLITGENNLVHTFSKYYNGIGFNDDDGYFWCVRINQNTFKPVAVDVIDPKDWSVVTSTSFTSNTGFVTGAYNNSDKTYMIRGGSGVIKIFDGDPNSGTYAQQIRSFVAGGAGVPDVALNPLDGLFYGLKDGKLHVYNPDTETSTNLGTLPGIPSSGAAFGAGYSTLDGKMYFSENNSGGIYEIDMAISPYTARKIADGPGNVAKNDGTKSLYVGVDGSCLYDTDGDGIPDATDTDSDNDGCPDAIEGGMSFLYNDLDGDLRLTGGVDADGVPLVANGGQPVGTSQDSTQQNCPTDLEVTKTDGVPMYQRGQNTVYTIVAKNNGPIDVENATVSDPIPSGVNSFSWTAAFHGTASNSSSASGSGAIADNVDLAVGDSIVYTVTAAVSGTKFGDLENTVTINTPTGMEDTDSTNNIATDIDADPDPSSCFIMMTDFEDYTNCTGPSYDQFTEAYSGNSAWVNSNHTAGLFVHDPGNCTNIINGHILPHADGGTAYAGLHSPLNGNTQEVIIGTLPTNLYAGQEYEISFIGVSIFVRNQAQWDEYGEVEFFGIEEGTNPVLNATTQKDGTAIIAIPEVDHLGTSATVDSRTQWNEYSFKFTPTRNYDRLLLAPRGNFSYVGIDNIIIKVAAQTIEVDTIAVCTDTPIAILPYDIKSGNPDQYAIDWDDAANAAGIADVAQTTLLVDSQFVLSGIESVPVGIYKAEVRVFNTLLGCEGTDSIYFVVENCVTDAEVTKTDFTDKYFAGATSIYTIVARNHGPAAVLDGDVSDPLPAGILAGDVTWTATTFGGATTAAVGVNNGALTDVVNIPSGDSIVYTVNIIVPLTFTGDLVNTVTISADNDTFPDNDVAVDTDTKDCNFEASGTIDSRVAGWVKMGNVVTGVPYKISPTGGSRTFVPSNGPEAGETITALIYNTGSGNSVSLTRNRYRPNNSRIDQLTIYDSSPHGWTGLSGSGTERPPVLGFMAFIDVNRNGQFDSGLETFYRDITSLTMTPNTSGELYMAFYDDGVYTDNSGTIGISVKSELESTDIGADTAICVGESVMLDAQNSDAASWEWSTGESTQTINVDTAGEYSVEITSVGGCEIHDTIVIETHDIDVVLPNDTAFCFGESYDVFAQSDSAVVWNWDNGDVGQSIIVDATGHYKIMVENSFGCTDSDSITITVHALPIVTVRDTTICPGGKGIFEAVSATATDYLWQKEGDGTTQSITDSIVGFYEVIITDANGCKDTTEAELTFHTPPTVTVNNDTICIGDAAATFTATSATATSYAWSENGTGTQATTTGTTAGDYTVIVEDINTCKDTAIGTLKVDTLPIVSLDDAAICASETSVDLTAESTTAVAYAWSGLGVGTTKTITAITQGSYIVTVTDENGCESSDDADLQRYPMPTVTVANESVCPGDEATFTAVSVTATEYLWQKEGTGIAQTTLGSIAGMYEVIVSDVNGCKDTAEGELIIYVPPTVTVNNDTICIGDAAATFTATSPTATNYVWSENGSGTQATTTGTDAGNYTVIVTDINNCKDTATGILKVDTLPHVSVEDTVICSNVPSVDLIATSTTAIDYLWSGTGTGNTSSITGTDAGIYVVTVTDENGCEQQDDATIFIVEQPDTFSIMGLDNACEGDVIDLSITETAQTIEWTTNESGQSITVEVTGTYGVELSNTANGLTCSEDAEKEVEFLPYPIDPIIEEFKNCFAYQRELEIHIETPASVIWDDGDSRTIDSTFIVTDIGSYNASLFYYPQCPIEATVEVEEFCPMTIFVPNAFTPNDDGTNDTFQPKMHNVESYKLYIFNRWGQLIFTSTNESNQWDGTYLGNECQIDVYVYKIVVEGYYIEGDLEKERMVGTVTLLR